MKKDKDVYIWGCGTLARRYIKQLPNEIEIKGIIDSDIKKRGLTGIIHNGKELNCVKDDLKETDFVIIAVENPHVANSISKILDKRRIEWNHIYKVVDDAFLQKGNYLKGKRKSDGIVKFVDVMVPTSKCNLQCYYCYLSHLEVNFDNVSDLYHDAKYIRHALSQERLGGSAFINLCGVGETLLCDKILDITRELINEGHYVQIVTNATPESYIKSFVHSDIDSSHLFFKCSLHYEELKKKNLLSKFAYNVRLLDEWGASFSVEYVPMDESVKLISEIKEYSMENFGALPHVTVTRDERYRDFRPLTKYTLDEYKKIWGVFESEMFQFKIDYVMNPQKHYCMAGLWSAELNLATGDLFQCTNNPRIGNIYQDIDKNIEFKEVGNECCLPYCFNSHAYLTFGLMPGYETPTYLDMRDRIRKDGSHWIKGELRNVFSQKLGN